MFRDTKKRTLARVVTMVLAMAVVTSSATDARATPSDFRFGAQDSETVSPLFYGLVAYEASVIGLVIHDLGDMDMDSPRSTKNFVADIVLSIPHWVGCLGGLGKLVGDDVLLAAVYFCGTASILTYHARVVELGRQKPPSKDAEPTHSATEPAKSLSWGPMLLGKDATFGLGLVGRF